MRLVCLVLAVIVALKGPLSPRIVCKNAEILGCLKMTYSKGSSKPPGAYLVWDTPKGGLKESDNLSQRGLFHKIK